MLTLLPSATRTTNAGHTNNDYGIKYFKPIKPKNANFP